VSHYACYALQRYAASQQWTRNRRRHAGPIPKTAARSRKAGDAARQLAFNTVGIMRNIRAHNVPDILRAVGSSMQKGAGSFADDIASLCVFQQTPLQSVWGLVVLAIGIIEAFSVYGCERPPFSLLEDGWWTLKKDRTPGDFGFDPLGFFSGSEAEKLEMQTKELCNGRFAMIAIAGMVAQGLVTGAKIF